MTLAQLTLIKLFLYWDRLSEHHRLAGYARQTLLRIYLREQQRLRSRYEVSQPEVPDRPAVAQPVDDQIILKDAINRLAARQRQVIVLRFCAGLSVEQTSVALSCSSGTVTSTTHRALKVLRAMLGEAPFP